MAEQDEEVGGTCRRIQIGTFKINALRMLVMNKAEEYFDLWEADRDTTDAAKSYEELLSKVTHYSRRRKLNSSAMEKIQHGRDPMDVGAVGG